MSLGKFDPKGPFETRLFINGEFVVAALGKTFDSVNPFTEEVIAKVHLATKEDVDVAVAAAAKAFKSWKCSNPTNRRDLILKLAALVEENLDYLASLESLDMGKPFSTSGYSSRTDVASVISCLRYYAGWSEKVEGRTVPVDGNYLAFVTREPLGVVGQIIPWNFPLVMAAWKLGPALCTGNTVVLKTSEKSPLSALALAKLVIEAGFPPGVVNILSGDGPTTGEPLAQHMGVSKIAFTGSTATGKKIQAVAAKTNLKKVSLELGGKSPMVVFPDANLDQAVQAAHDAIFSNTGQVCCAGSRLFVHDEIYDAFVARLVALAKKMRVGDPFDSKTEQGPIVDAIQFKRVMNYIEQGKAEGATVATGGNRVGAEGFLVEPTVFTDVKDEMTIAKEEIFGPVLCVLRFSSVEEAIQRANETPYGLAAGVCTRDVGLAIRMSRCLEAGTVWINCWDAFSDNVAFGGFKMSGVGRELGEQALELYTQTKSTWIPIDPENAVTLNKLM